MCLHRSRQGAVRRLLSPQGHPKGAGGEEPAGGISTPSGVFKPYAVARSHALAAEEGRERMEQSFLAPKADIAGQESGIKAVPLRTGWRKPTGLFWESL